MRHLLGCSPFIAGPDIVIGSLATLLAMSLLLAGRRRAKPWFERSHVEEATVIE